MRSKGGTINTTGGWRRGIFTPGAPVACYLGQVLACLSPTLLLPPSTSLHSISLSLTFLEFASSLPCLSLSQSPSFFSLSLSLFFCPSLALLFLFFPSHSPICLSSVFLSQTLTTAVHSTTPVFKTLSFTFTQPFNQSQEILLTSTHSHTQNTFYLSSQRHWDYIQNNINLNHTQSN